MTKVLYQPHTFLVKPIAKPEKISIFRHTVLFINEEDEQSHRKGKADGQCHVQYGDGCSLL